MLEPTNFIIKNLLQEGRLAEAYQDVLALLKKNPNDQETRDLYDQITKAISKQNHEIIDNKLEEIKNHITDGNYAEAITIGVKLKLYEPDNKELLKLISEATNLYNRSQNQIKDQQKSDFQERIKTLRANSAYLEAIKLIETEYKRKADPFLLKQNLELRNEFVEMKLKQNSKAMELLPPEKVIEFLKDLSRFAPKNPNLIELQDKFKQRLSQKNLANRKQYIEEAKRQIKVLYYQKKYDKAKQACLELTKADPKSTFAKKYYLKSLTGIAKQNHETAYQKLADYIKTLNTATPEQLNGYLRV